jgi:DeoR/GlpR family transcriptional regulator of sugar metabolism
MKMTAQSIEKSYKNTISEVQDARAAPINLTPQKRRPAYLGQELNVAMRNLQGYRQRNLDARIRVGRVQGSNSGTKRCWFADVGFDPKEYERLKNAVNRIKDRINTHRQAEYQRRLDMGGKTAASAKKPKLLKYTEFYWGKAVAFEREHRKKPENTDNPDAEFVPRSRAATKAQKRTNARFNKTMSNLGRFAVVSSVVGGAKASDLSPAVEITVSLLTVFCVVLPLCCCFLSFLYYRRRKTVTVLSNFWRRLLDSWLILDNPQRIFLDLSHSVFGVSNIIPKNFHVDEVVCVNSQFFELHGDIYQVISPVGRFEHHTVWMTLLNVKRCSTGSVSQIVAVPPGVHLSGFERSREIDSSYFISPLHQTVTTPSMYVVNSSVVAALTQYLSYGDSWVVCFLGFGIRLWYTLRIFMAMWKVDLMYASVRVVDSLRKDTIGFIPGAIHGEKDSIIGSAITKATKSVHPHFVITGTLTIFKLFNQTVYRPDESEIVGLQPVVPFLADFSRHPASSYEFKSSNAVFESKGDNGSLVFKGGKGIMLKNGKLEFESEFEHHRTVYVYGPHLTSAYILYDTASTKAMSSAFTRLIQVREGENVYRTNQDLVAFHVFLGVAPQKDGAPVPSYVTNTATLVRWDLEQPWGMHWDVLLARADQTRALPLFLAIVEFMRGWFTACRDYSDSFLASRKAEIINVYFLVRSKEYAERPHDKRDIRIKAVTNISEFPGLLDKKTTVKAQVKWEIAKYGKLARQYIAMGDTLAMTNPTLPEFLKKCMDGIREFTVHINGFLYTVMLEFMGNGNDGRLDEMFNLHYEDIVEMPTTSTLIRASTHGDDSLSGIPLKVLVDGMVRAARVILEIDISACDMSHGPGIFAILRAYSSMIFGPKLKTGELDTLLKQLQSDVSVSHPQSHLGHYALFMVKHMLLMSGSVLTTIVNEMAVGLLQGMIAIKLISAPPMHPSQVDAFCIEAAAVAGYKVTCKSVIVYEDDDRKMVARAKLPTLSFLKHFPVWGYDRFFAQKCIGSMFRKFGIIDRQLTEDRVQFMTGIVKSWSNCHYSSVMDEIYSHFGIEHRDLDVDLGDRAFGTFVSLPVERRDLCTESFCYRYRLTPSELLEGIRFFFSDLRECLVQHPHLQRFVEVDYELGAAHTCSSG